MFSILAAIPPKAYTGLLHTHKLVVLLFLVIYVVKLGFLLFSEANLEKMRNSKFAKIFEMVISVLFLLTGIAMWTTMAPLQGNAQLFFYIKIGAVLASIPLAVVGFKKKNKVLAIFSVVLLFAAYGLAEMKKKQALKPIEEITYQTENTSIYGKQLYTQYCQSCHGADGAAGLSGAANLQTSVISDTDAIMQIKKGKGNMPAYENILNEEEIKAVLTHIKSLRK